jgi:stearoyl-CoA desaturase (delta-9 desaturase)
LTAIPTLDRPSTTRPAVVLLRYTVPIATVHVLALSVLWPALFSWTGVALCVAGVHFFGQAITMGYHRLLAHRSFGTPRWFEHALVTCALCSLADSPARWVATHRMHHAHSDEQEDPHSPLVTFLWGHLGWLMIRNNALHHRASYERYAQDILRDPFYMWLEKRPWRPLWFYAGQVALYAGAGFGAALLWTDAVGAAWFAASLVAWGVLLRTVIVWHITWSVNSLTHMFGYRNHDTEEHSTNNWLVALLASGEGWHNNHHADPSCCNNQHRWWEADITHWQVRAMEKVGLTWNVTPRREVRAAQARELAAERAAERKRADAARRGDADGHALVGAGAGQSSDGSSVT